MIKKLTMLFLVLILSTNLYAQRPTESGDELTVGRTATLGVEATTAFAWDLDSHSTGLETKVGMELIFPLFPTADRGIIPDENETGPHVRLVLKDATFLWRYIYATTPGAGGNFEQDSFNPWGQTRPLILTFDTFMADVVWENYFFRVAGTSSVMRVNQASLISIFDDVMDARDRYYRRSSTRALWFDERYNVQNFPLLREKMSRDFLDVDYRSRNDVSGILAGGVEYDWFSVVLKAASNKRGQDNEDNAWLFGMDVELLPMENLKVEFTSLAGLNYDKTIRGENPVAFGTSAEYRMPFSETLIFAPKAGFDFSHETVSKDSQWELGVGALLYTRGQDFLLSSRLLDWDNVIPAGFSASLNINHNNYFNVMLSWFDPAGRDSVIPNFGGFLQLELGDLFGQGTTGPDYAILAQIEYSIEEKITPYVRVGYMPEFHAGQNDAITGDYLLKGAVGVFLTPIHFFSVDIRYEMDRKLLTDGGGMESVRNLFSTVFTIRM
ncbi:MAG: hypothetical protein LBC80_00735 [Treponema sp.]|jgi:hypothetical protein|nr:hypothetical protein [Treponema sp.]